MPAEVRTGVLSRALLSGDGMLGELLLEPADNDLLRPPVCLTDKDKITLVRDVQCPFHLFAENHARLLRVILAHLAVGFVHAYLRNSKPSYWGPVR